ncbi:hypothetical protein psyc5s11_50800 [Clostridium gelidum]|uniref:Phosphatidylglycerol lysyltransferase n=1 Tax=Clostridium gelidum TaxID=704125 RepID=A0ABN6J6K4_9CLOT|nr:lysylphosphatidylglycerol synthase transmembrane domain-containing protein [Clostridium gelidum]BCZ49013.1 hypothetical protein psyc5s11_50800 [Clostridium gelidum]
MILFMLVAIITLLIGHVFKVLRWSLFIDVYEKPNINSLLLALSTGHMMNALLPIRLGDFVRMYISGKNMKNRYFLAISTVLIDIYLDVVVVGVIFALLLIFPGLSDTFAFYARIFVILAIASTLLLLLFFRFSKPVKKIIRYVSSIFNQKIELRILYLTWSLINSLKDILRKLNKSKFLLYTLGIWGAYIISYYLFATAVTKMGIEMTTVDVFLTVFTSNCWSLFRNYNAMSGIYGFSMLMLVFTTVSLLPVLAFSIVGMLFSANSMTEVETKQKYRYLLPQLNPNEKLAFLEEYFSGENRDRIYLYVKINQDVNVIQDCSAGSNAITILCMANDETFYRKYAFGEDAYKLKEQICWLQNHEKFLPLPKIMRNHFDDSYCSYDMEYDSSAVGFFTYIHSISVEESWNKLSNVLKVLHSNLHTNNLRNASNIDIHKYINEKVEKNIDLIKNFGGKFLKALYEYDYLIINGTRYKNLKHYNHILNHEFIYKIFMNDPCSDIHGDMTIENIICLLQSGDREFYLIDPNTGNVHETSYLDYSKLLQSLHGGYEFLMATTNVEIEGNSINFLYAVSHAYKRLYERYNDYLYKNFDEESIKSIYFHEIVHYLRLMPYKIRKDPKKAIIFYAGLIMVLDDVCNMFLLND